MKLLVFCRRQIIVCNYKETGLQSSIIATKELAEEMKIKPVEMTFPRSAEVRRLRKKVQ